MKTMRLPILLSVLLALTPAASAGWSGPGNLPETRLLHKTAMIASLPPAQRKTVPNFVMADAQGVQHDIASYRGRVVLVNFWATWCAPCIKEMPTLDNLQKLVGGRDFQVLTVSQDAGGADAVAKFFQRQEIKSLKVLTDPDSAAFRALGLRGLPTTLVLDRKGRAAVLFEGPTEWDSKQVVDMLSGLIAESP